MPVRGIYLQPQHKSDLRKHKFYKEVSPRSQDELIFISDSESQK